MCLVKIATTMDDRETTGPVDRSVNNENGIEPSNDGAVNIPALIFNNTGNFVEIDACKTVFYLIGTLDPVDLDEAPLASFYSVASRAQLRSTLNHFGL